jgi:hypothetical protein
MPDITMCDSPMCLKAEQCYRFMAVPSIYRQSYADFYVPGEECSHYSPIRDGDRITRPHLPPGHTPEPVHSAPSGETAPEAKPNLA